jgi:acyl dehydratase
MSKKEIISYFGNYFEDFEIDTVFHHTPGKTITESDNNFFTLITMNHHPLHIDKPFAEASQHKKILVVGTLVFSLAVGQSVKDISCKAIANLGYDKVVHFAPVFIGDTIYSRSIIKNKVESKSKLDRGVITVETIVVNQDDVKVLSFERKVLIPKKNKGRS